MNNEQWAGCSRQWAVSSEQWTMNNEQWTLSNEQWTMSSEQWAVCRSLKSVFSIGMSPYECHAERELLRVSCWAQSKHRTSKGNSFLLLFLWCCHSCPSSTLRIDSGRNPYSLHSWIPYQVRNDKRHDNRLREVRSDLIGVVTPLRPETWNPKPVISRQ